MEELGWVIDIVMNKGHVLAITPWQALNKIYKRHGKTILIKTWPCFLFIWKYEIESR
jgi:hypothetical protein